MPTNPSLPDHGHKTLEEFAAGISRDFAVIADINKASATRLVWFVAISGFALLNVQTLAEAVAKRPLEGVLAFLLVLPWALAALAGVVAHWLLGEMTSRDTIYYVLRINAVRASLANLPPVPKIPQVLNVLHVDENDSEVANRKQAVSAVAPWATFTEKLTFALLIFALLWSVLFPLGVLTLCSYGI